ncbi:MAG: penicillin acylase family protein [Thermodesulfobacteriota bacterium]
MSGRNHRLVWDEKWGVPYIYADDMEGLAYGLAQAQMRNHRDKILVLYAQARGRSAEYFGEKSGPGPNHLTKSPEGINFLMSDCFVRTMGLPQLGRRWYAIQEDEARRCADAFAQGLNDFARDNPALLSAEARRVLPVSGEDVLLYWAYIFLGLHFGPRRKVVEAWLKGSETELTAPGQDFKSAGSNGWVIGPPKSASGNPMLLANPHSQWDVDSITLMEAQVAKPLTAKTLGDMDFMFHGACLLGLPFLALGCNQHLGWTFTMNPHAAMTLFAVPMLGEEHYLFDGQKQAFEIEQQKLKIRRADGQMDEVPLVIRRSPRHDGAPVLLVKEQTALVAQAPALDRGHGPQQYLDMMRADSLDRFRAAIKRMQLPNFNLLYAGRDRDTRTGHIFYFFNTHTPRRPFGDYAYWWKVVPGHTSATLSSGILDFDELPQVIDPPTGWLQNCNDPPWTCTWPGHLKPESYPAYLTPVFMHLRAQLSARLLLEKETLSLEEMITQKHSTRNEMAGRVMEDLLAAARRYGAPEAQQAAAVLAAWDRRAEADSRGAVLFLYWLLAMNTDDHLATGLFATEWSVSRTAPAMEWRESLRHPTGLKNPVRAAAALDLAARRVVEDFGSLDIPWGQAIKPRVGEYEISANGGPGDPMGYFRAIPLPIPLRPNIYGGVLPAQRIENEGGENFIMAVEFTPDGPRGRVVLTYGNASYPGSPHAGDQLKFLENKTMRELRFEP